MKKYLVSLILLTCIVACDDAEPCELIDLPSTCSDVIPEEECLAFFNRWFYDGETKSCNEIGYSGCEEYGFATEEECLACVCN